MNTWRRPSFQGSCLGGRTGLAPRLGKARPIDAEGAFHASEGVQKGSRCRRASLPPGLLATASHARERGSRSAFAPLIGLINPVGRGGGGWGGRFEGAGGGGEPQPGGMMGGARPPRHRPRYIFIFQSSCPIKFHCPLTNPRNERSYEPIMSSNCHD